MILMGVIRRLLGLLVSHNVRVLATAKKQWTTHAAPGATQTLLDHKAEGAKKAAVGG